MLTIIITDMPYLNIVIHRADKKEPSLPEYGDAKGLEIDHCALIERGTASGRAVIAFGLRNPGTGELFTAQLTEGLFDMITGGLRGAKEHWRENPV